MTDTDTAIDVDREHDEPGPPRILITNDDGIESPGIRLLARALGDEHDDVLVAAPASDMSGSGTAMGRYDPEQPVALREASIDGVEAYSVAGPPGLAVMAAALGAFGDPPTLVVSGINAGMNTGHSIIHSGTVGAALSAHTFGARGVAISLAPSDPWQWDTAVQVARKAVRWALRSRARTALNVNVPARPFGELRGVRWADLDEFGYFQVARADVAGEALELTVRDRRSGLRPDTDTALCFDGYVTLTMLSPVEPAEHPTVDADEVVAFGR